jgi:hypothetical protein
VIPRPERLAVALAAAAIFAVFVLTSDAVFRPRFDAIDPFDEATYVNNGRLLAEHGRLPVLAQNPLLALFYGGLHVVVGSAPSWFVRSVWVGRVLLAGLVWFGAVSLAMTLGGGLAAGAMIVLLWLSPAVVSLVQNSSDALFAGLSALALQQTVASIDRDALRRLATASTLVALAAFSRNDGLPLFALFLVLALAGAGGRLRDRALAAALPFVAIVGGYLLVRVAVTGTLDDVASLRWRSYMAFEQGQGVTFAERYPAGTSPYVEGHVASRQLYGTPEDNHLSVVRAIGRNWPAFAERVVASVRQIPGQARGAYGASFGIIGVLWLWGVVALSTSRYPRRRGAAAILWPLHLGAYLLTFFRPGYFLLPCATILAVAAVGARDLVTAGSVVLGRMVPFPRAAATGSLALVLAGTLAFDLAHHRPAMGRERFGSMPSERAILFLQHTVPPDARVAAYGPAPVWAARGEYVSLILSLRDLQTPRELARWLDRERVRALYVEDSLRGLEPRVWALVEGLIGTSLTVAFSDGPIRILTVSGTF